MLDLGKRDRRGLGRVLGRVEGVFHVLKGVGETKWCDGENTESVLFHVAVKEGGDAETLMLVGHNPAIEDVASLLAGRGDTATLKRLHDKFPTAALAVIDVDAQRFADTVPGGGHLAAFVTPAVLGPA